MSSRMLMLSIPAFFSVSLSLSKVAILWTLSPCRKTDELMCLSAVQSYMANVCLSMALMHIYFTFRDALSFAIDI